MRGKPLILKKLDNGCIVPTSHKLNADGYFRYHIPHNGKGRSPLVMYHRYVWEQAYGKIPDGYEIDHICKIEHVVILNTFKCLKEVNMLRKIITYVIRNVRIKPKNIGCKIIAQVQLWLL